MWLALPLLVMVTTVKSHPQRSIESRKRSMTHLLMVAFGFPSFVFLFLFSFVFSLNGRYGLLFNFKSQFTIWQFASPNFRDLTIRQRQRRRRRQLFQMQNCACVGCHVGIVEGRRGRQWMSFAVLWKRDLNLHLYVEGKRDSNEGNDKGTKAMWCLSCVLLFCSSVSEI